MFTLDNENQLFFYEQEFYVFSNFSSFNLRWKGIVFYTSEVAYHWEKFLKTDNEQIAAEIRYEILAANSSHEAFKIARKYDNYKRKDWDLVKVDIMREILKEKVNQHEYVKKKLIESGNKELIENSWRDSFWGWGEDKQGKNMLGNLWMSIRSELLAAK